MIINNNFISSILSEKYKLLIINEVSSPVVIIISQ